jgi:hypothetical protein
MRKDWLKPLAFGLILWFALNLEIAIWDSLMLSESISFSLLALLLAGWVTWVTTCQKEIRAPIKILCLSVMIVVTVLYSFTRESNLYFVVLGAVVFALISFSKIVSKEARPYMIAYLVAAIVLLVVQNLSFGSGNRWQIHIYDHLAKRVIPNQERLDYFVAAGLPLSEQLIGITDMPGYEYQPYLMFDSEMGAVRDWVNQKGVSTYLMYLITHPLDSVSEPFRKITLLLNGENTEYHYPRYAVPTIPDWLTTLTRRLYPREPLVMWGFFAVMVVGVGWYFSKGNARQPAWLVVLVFLLSLYPMMFIVWHGNPLEIERHAAQIGLQFRLAGWMGLLLLLDHLSVGELLPLEKREKLCV